MGLRRRLQTHPVWVGTDGERLVINTETHRQKYNNVERDPKVTLTIRDEENPYRYAKVRGEVVQKVRGQEARDHIDELSRKYQEVPWRRLPAREHRERAGDAVDRTFPPDSCGPQTASSID